MNNNGFLYGLLVVVSLIACSGTSPILDKDEAACIAFYNVENLFDTENDPMVNDDEFTPKGAKKWTRERYQSKLKKMAKTLFDVGVKYVSDGASIIGLAEVENRKVLEDLINTDSLPKRDYGIVHFESPDKRGIDVALLYQKNKFRVIESEAIKVNGTKNNGQPLVTRDILKVVGVLNSDTCAVFVNHWPSRREGKELTQVNRKLAALALAAQVKKVKRLFPGIKVIVMGDFNDNPNDANIKKYLVSKSVENQVVGDALFNPYEQIHRRGSGTTPYRGEWFMFDQILFSASVLQQKDSSFSFLDARVFDAPYLFQQGGKYDGYIHRNYAGLKYLDGYSDHLPVYAILSKN